MDRKVIVKINGDVVVDDGKYVGDEREIDKIQPALTLYKNINGSAIKTKGWIARIEIVLEDIG